MNTVKQTHLERKLWVVTGPDGQRHFIERAPLEGIENWARGQNVIIDEFVFRERIHPKVAASPIAAVQTRKGGK